MLLHIAPSPSNRNRLKIYAVVFAVATLAVLSFRSPVDTAPQFTEYDVPTTKSVPYDIVLGGDGNLWFSEYAGNKIGRTNQSGQITEFGLPAEKSFPSRMRAGSDKQLWFLEQQVSRIGRISSSGSIREFSMTEGSGGWLAIGADGNLWSDTSDKAIGRMTPTGVLTEFRLPHPGFVLGMDAAKDGSIWFVEAEQTSTDITTGLLARITNDGKITEYPLHTISDQSDIANGAYQAVDGLAIATDGSIWFVEPNNDRIMRRSKSGLLTAYALPTPKSHAFVLVAGTHDDVWFTRDDQNKFGRVTAQGKVTEYDIPTPHSRPGGIALDKDGNVWVAEFDSNKILKATVPH